MYPFYDENYFGNEFYSMHDPYMSYPAMYQPFQQNRLSPLKKLTGNLNLQKTLSGATKTISTINQVIPIIYQAQPVLRNAKNAIRIMKAVKKVNDIDLDEIDQAVNVDTVTKDVDSTPNTEANSQQLFENML